MTASGLQVVIFWFLALTAVDHTGQAFNDVDQVTRYHEVATCHTDRARIQAQLDDLIDQGKLVAQHENGKTTKAYCQLHGEMTGRH